MTEGSKTAAGHVFADVETIARSIAAMPLPRLLVFDCDGVLAPLVDHADDSVLLDGIGDLLAKLARSGNTTVAILSGRSLKGLAQFNFDEAVVVAGSYGGERRGIGTPELNDDEVELLRRLDEITVEAAEVAGDGAWVERKPTSVVVHVREADPARRVDALRLARQRSAELLGHELHEGGNVIELMARPTDKGVGLDRLREECEATSVLYIGDDVPDEAAIARLTAAGDVSIKVGTGDTVATFRLADPAAVHSLLSALAR
ncbi:MAG: trehalose 6-phosphate phosphatase [Candidatus Aldehydirespiratoraceae bacterium]